MGALTEREIIDCMETNLGLAIQNCEDLARLPLKGPSYVKLRENLKLIEGCCRQASAWREDTRWLNVGLVMAEAHKRAGDWLRGNKTPEGVRIKLAPGEMHPLFMKLADNLRSLQLACHQLRHQRVGKLGMILPPVLPAPHRDTRPSRVILPETMAPKRLILPPGTAA